MTTMQVVVLLVVVVLLAGLTAAGLVWWRRQELRKRFGPEYDRVVSEQDSRLAAERELRERERLHAQLTLRPLRPESRQRYTQEWERVQAMFLDDPAEAVVAGDELVTRLVAERGYPTGDFDEQTSYLSVEHADTLGHYRDAHDIFLRGQQGSASTEELRQALVHYRALFAELLDGDLDVVDDEAATRDTAGARDAESSRAGGRGNWPDNRGDGRPEDGAAAGLSADKARPTGDTADAEPQRSPRYSGGGR
jgi:hypothetical protein